MFADWVLQYTDLAVYCLILQIVILGLDKNVLQFAKEDKFQKR